MARERGVEISGVEESAGNNLCDGLIARPMTKPLMKYAMFEARVDTLPEPQQRFWPELQWTPKEFVLYGGTALVLRLGHRQSEDFDFFSTSPFDPARLHKRIAYLRGAEVVQRLENTLTCLLDRRGEIHVSFFGGLSLNRIEDADIAAGPDIKVASLLDLAATKAEVVQSRASAKDYIDIDALIQAGITLAQALGAAQAVYGESFNPLLTLKALTFFGDGDLQTVPTDIQKRLRRAVQETDLEHTPTFAPQQGLTMSGRES